MIGHQPGSIRSAGRATAEHLLHKAFQAAAGKRTDGKGLAPLLHLLPAMRAHRWDAILGLVFVVLSSASTLALTIASRRLVDRGFRVHTAEALLTSFLVAAATAAIFAIATALRIYFVNKLGEGMIVD